MTKIRPDILFGLQKLFENKKWAIESSNNFNLSLFDKFCERLKLLEHEEQKMLLDLTANYMRIGINEYLERFYDSIFCLGDTLFQTKTKIFVYPLVKPYVKLTKDEDGPPNDFKIQSSKTKSAGFLHYMFDAHEWRWISTKFIPHSSIRFLIKNFTNNDSVLLLIDDFVGSGKTVIETCKEYLSERYTGEAINPVNIKVVSIAAQKEGIQRVKDELGIDVISNIILNKGITENYTQPDSTQKLLMMESIGKRLGVSDDIYYGYEKSESLITFMNKTPNNTFPVYWHETRSKIAPFPRRKIYGG